MRNIDLYMGLIFLALITTGVWWVSYKTNLADERVSQLENRLKKSDNRNSLSLLPIDVFEQIDKEIGIQKNENVVNSFSLSQPLIGRIVALSRASKPYKILDGEGVLSQGLISKERGELLIYLIQSGLSEETLDIIFSAGDFSFSFIEDSNLKGAKLKRINLGGSKIVNTDLSQSDLTASNLFNTNLERSSFYGASLRYCNLNGADLSHTNLSYADLSYADLSLVNLSNAKVENTRLVNSKLMGANLSNINNLEVQQLTEISSLYSTINLDSKFQKALMLEKPCLFTKENCK